MRFIVAVGALAAIFGTGGCQRTEPPSAIVQKALEAGAGDLSTASTDSIRHWLGQHRSVAVEVDKMCAPVQPAASRGKTASVLIEPEVSPGHNMLVRCRPPGTST